MAAELACRVWQMPMLQVQALIARAAAVQAIQPTPTPPTPPTPAQQPAKPYAMAGRMAAIPLVGVMTRYASEWDDMLGLTAVEPLRAAMAAAQADNDVDGIALMIDSPGGYSDAGAVMAEAVRQSQKPVMAVVDGMCCSAAYWAASQARSITATKDSEIGSIGTYAVMTDDSRFWDRLGINFHVVSTGQFKGLGADGRVTEDYIAEVRRGVAGVQAQFESDVSAGRGMAMEAVKALATGQAWLADESKQLGLIDNVASRDAAMTAATTEVNNMTREQFDSYAAANPEAAQSLIEQGRKAGVADGIKAERTRVASILDACKANHALADKAIRSGAEVDQVALAVETAEAAAAENKRLSDELAKAKAQASHAAADTPLLGTRPPETSGASEPQAVNPREAAKAEWDKLSADDRSKWISEGAFIGFRSRQIARAE